MKIDYLFSIVRALHWYKKYFVPLYCTPHLFVHLIFQPGWLYCLEYWKRKIILDIWHDTTELSFGAILKGLRKKSCKNNFQSVLCLHHMLLLHMDRHTCSIRLVSDTDLLETLDFIWSKSDTHLIKSSPVLLYLHHLPLGSGPVGDRDGKR